MARIHETMENRTRRGNRTGSLRLRGLTFWARWKYKGQVFERSTGIKLGMPKAREKAVKKLDELTAPYRLAGELDLQTFMATKLKTLGEAVIEAHVHGTELTLGEAYSAFVKSPRRRRIKERSLGQYETILSALSQKFGHDRLMNKITQTAACEYAEEIGESVSNLTFNNYIAKIAHVWDVLGPQNNMTVNPWRGIVSREDDSLSRAPLTDEEIGNAKKISEANLGPEGRTLIVIGQNTGMRIGDCATLKWQDIDINTGFIRVKTEKTGAKVSIPILKELKDELTAIKSSANGTYVLPSLSKKADTISNIMADMFRKAGIETSKKTKKDRRARPYKTFHSLRTCFITMCAEAGVSLEIVKAVVGHTTQKMTEHYTHIRESAVKEAFSKAGIE